MAKEEPGVRGGQDGTRHVRPHREACPDDAAEKVQELNLQLTAQFEIAFEATVEQYDAALRALAE